MYYTFLPEWFQTHRVQAGNSLTLPCTPPQSNPAADVYWVLRSQDGRWEAVNFDKRVTMDFEGSAVYFLYIFFFENCIYTVNV